MTDEMDDRGHHEIAEARETDGNAVGSFLTGAIAGGMMGLRDRGLLKLDVRNAEQVSPTLWRIQAVTDAGFEFEVEVRRLGRLDR